MLSKQIDLAEVEKVQVAWVWPLLTAISHGKKRVWHNMEVNLVPGNLSANQSQPSHSQVGRCNKTQARCLRLQSSLFLVSVCWPGGARVTEKSGQQSDVLKSSVMTELSQNTEQVAEIIDGM